MKKIYLIIIASIILLLSAFLIVRGQMSGYGLSPVNIFHYAQSVISTNSTDYGIGIEMAPPSNATSSLSAGGSLSTSTTYYYIITASDGIGETIASNETFATPTSTNRTIAVSWTGSQGASKYYVYRATSTQGYLTSSLATTTTATSFTDAGATLATGTPPTANTAYVNKLATSTDSWILSGNFGVGTSNPQYKLDIQGNLGVSSTSTFNGDVVLSKSNSTSTLSVGTSDNGVNIGILCQWNGENYTMVSFAPNSIIPVYSTSTICN